MVSRFIQCQRWINEVQAKDLTVPMIFARIVEKHPNKTCFIFEDKTWTFKQVNWFSMAAVCICCVINWGARVHRSHSIQKLYIFVLQSAVYFFLGGGAITKRIAGISMVTSVVERFRSTSWATRWRTFSKTPVSNRTTRWLWWWTIGPSTWPFGSAWPKPASSRRSSTTT